MSLIPMLKTGNNMKSQINIEAIKHELESIFKELKQILDIITKKPQLRISKHPVRGQQLNIYRLR